MDKASRAKRTKSRSTKTPTEDTASLGTQSTAGSTGTVSTDTRGPSVLSLATDRTGSKNKASTKTKVSDKRSKASRATASTATKPSTNAVVIPIPVEEDADLQRKLHLAHLWEQVNFCGTYQYIVFFLTLLPNLLGGLVLLQNVFVLGTPHYRCFITGCENNATRNFSDPMPRTSIPYDNKSILGAIDNEVCSRYVPQWPDGWTNTCNATGFTSSIKIACDAGYVFDYSSIAPSAVNEFGLVCEKEGQVVVAKAVFMSGMLFSSIICGSLADYFGRVSTYWWAPTLLILTGILSANASDILTYTISSFFMSFCTYGMVISDFTLGVEVVPKNARVRAGNGYPVTFAIGQGIMALVFYACHNWRHALLVITAMNASLLILPVLMPESVKWRIAKGGKHQHHKAKKEIHRIARINNVTINENADDNPLDPETVATLSMRPPSWLEMVKSKLMVRWVINMCFGWFFSALTYYGVTFSTGNLASNIYWSFVLMAFIEVPFVLSLTLLMKWFGRRTLYCGSFFMSSFAAFVAAILPHEFAIYPGLAVKGFISVALNLSYVYTVEIFPSVSRTRGLGFCSMFARVGTIVSPFAADFKWLGSNTPLIFFGIICLIYGFVALDLPETKGKELPETLDDLRKLKKKKPL